MNKELLKAKIAEAISSQNTSGNQKLEMILAAVDTYSSADNGAKPTVSGSLPLENMLKLCELIINSKTADGITGRIRDMSLSIRDELKYVHKVGCNDH